jgi:putative protease
VVQSVRPVKVFLAYSPGTAARILRDSAAPLPFPPGELIISLDPFFPEAQEAALVEDVRGLIEKGCRQFVVNNPGHFSLFRNTSCSLIAGPYLYVFNRWAQAFVADQGISHIVSPLENNRQNLERTIDPSRRASVFITVISYPALFRLRSDLGGIYQFGDFSDSRDEKFRLVSESGGSRVYPEQPFSIVDKIPFLQEAGFSRFIVDLAGAAPLKKPVYKNIMNAVKNALPLPGTVRFNWKDGFYQDQEPGREKRDPPG